MKNEWTRLTAEPSICGESPFWHPTEQRLYWVDILGKQIHRLHVESKVQDSWLMPGDACCIAPAKSGGLVIALRDGFYRGEVWGGDVKPIATVGLGHFDFDTSTHRFNDGKCDSQGRFWCGTMNEPRTENDGALFSLEMQDGKPIVKKQATGMTVSNGLAWSKDDRTMYWSDSFGHTLHVFDWDAKANEISSRRVLKDFPRKGAEPDYGGRPDGAAMDADGNYYVCLMEAGMLLKLAPDHKELARIPLPVGFATMPCFGGVDLKTLFVTSLRENRTPEELAEQPGLGHVFFKRVDVAGAPVNCFKD